MKVFVDADACPGPVRDIILRAAHRNALVTIFVANKALLLPDSPYVSSVLVAAGPDVADAYIAAEAVANDLVVTQDIPLSAILVRKSVAVVSPRGDIFNEENIGERLASRDLMQDLRDASIVSGGPKSFDEKTKRQFANVFDSSIQKLLRKTRPVG